MKRYIKELGADAIRNIGEMVTEDNREVLQDKIDAIERVLVYAEKGTVTNYEAVSCITAEWGDARLAR